MCCNEATWGPHVSTSLAETASDGAYVRNVLIDPLAMQQYHHELQSKPLSTRPCAALSGHGILAAKSNKKLAAKSDKKLAAKSDKKLAAKSNKKLAAKSEKKLGGNQIMVATGFVLVASTRGSTKPMARTQPRTIPQTTAHAPLATAHMLLTLPLWRASIHPLPWYMY